MGETLVRAWEPRTLFRRCALSSPPHICLYFLSLAFCRYRERCSPASPGTLRSFVPSYAREKSNVTLRELELSDNFVTRGSAIFIDNSTLSTFKVSEKCLEQMPT